jgi:hypothetical protein
MTPAETGVIIFNIMNKLKIDKITFELDEYQIKKYREWRESIPEEYFGAAGGGEQFIFIPTGLGIIVKVKYGNDHEIDLTDYENF